MADGDRPLKQYLLLCLHRTVCRGRHLRFLEYLQSRLFHASDELRDGWRIVGFEWATSRKKVLNRMKDRHRKPGSRLYAKLFFDIGDRPMANSANATNAAFHQNADRCKDKASTWWGHVSLNRKVSVLRDLRSRFRQAKMGRTGSAGSELRLRRPYGEK